MKATNSYRRPVFFSTTEVYVQVGGEWVRDDTRSQRTLTEMANAFCDEQQAMPHFTSSPNTVLVHKNAEDTERTYRSSASLIYSTQEVIINGQTDQAAQGSAQRLAADINAQQVSQKVIQQIAAMFDSSSCTTVPSSVMPGGGATQL